MKTFDYVAWQARTVGRQAEELGRDKLWVPNLPEAEGPCLGVLKGPAGEGTEPAVAMGPDSHTLATGHPNGTVRLWNLASNSILWENTEEHTGRLQDLSFSNDYRRLASVAKIGSVRIWNVLDGSCLARWDIDNSDFITIRWSPDDKRITVGDMRSGHKVLVYDSRTGSCQLECIGHTDEVWCAVWSPDGAKIASGSADKTIRIWDSKTGRCLNQIEGHSAKIEHLSWSTHGQQLFSISDDKTIRIWSGSRLDPVARIAADHGAFSECIAESPDGRLLASSGWDDSVRLWDTHSSRELAQFLFAKSSAGNANWRLAWSPDGAFLVSSHPGDIFRFWDTRPFLRAPRRPNGKRHSVPPFLAALPAILARLHRLGLAAPLSLLCDLLQLTRGTRLDGWDALTQHAGMQRLIDLRWPPAAQVGLVALLLEPVPIAEPWRPPPGTTAVDLRDHLAEALSGKPIAPEAPPPPLAALRHAAELIDDRLITLLAALGPDAVAVDPGLPLRLRHHIPELPELAGPQRLLLGLRLRQPAAGRAQGTGSGVERTGLERRGDLRSILPSQLALPREVLTSRYLRGELLYRAHEGREPPRLRPSVLVLDVSPPVFGPTESTLRLAAHVLARSLLDAGVPAILVTAGGPSQVRPLERPADALDLWTLRSLDPASARRTLAVARAMRDRLADGPLEPRIVLFTQPWFGAEEDVPAVRGLRGFFVPYPGRSVRPVLAHRCERWQTVSAGAADGIVEALATLVG